MTAMSAFGTKADIRTPMNHVRFRVGGIADIDPCLLYPSEADVDYVGDIRFVLRVQPVTATLLVVHRQGFRIRKLLMVARPTIGRRSPC